MSEENIYIQKKNKWITKKNSNIKDDTSSTSNWITIKETPKEWITRKEDNDTSSTTEWITKKKKPEMSKGGIMTMKKIKAKKMATGGLMSMPPFIKKEEDKKDMGISPYDVNTPASARKGMPSRMMSPSRTRFNKGGNLDLDGSGDTTMKDVLIGRGVLDTEGNMIKKAMGGLMKRKKYGTGDEVLDEEAFEQFDIEDLKPKPKNVSTSELNEMRSMEALREMKDAGLELTEKQESDLAKYEASKAIKSERVKAAIGGMIGIEKGKYDQRPDYQAYAEGDMVEEMPMNVEESMLEKPVGMDENMDDEDITDEDLEGMDAIIDTSALSQEEETLLDEAVEMHPELEAIIPKLVATEFTDDGEVEGPGTGTSDSIPALLSDGEFVFTAKAVKHLGVDKLRKMMKQAEEAYDAGVQMQEEQQETV